MLVNPALNGYTYVSFKQLRNDWKSDENRSDQKLVQICERALCGSLTALRRAGTRQNATIRNLGETFKSSWRDELL